MTDEVAAEIIKYGGSAEVVQKIIRALPSDAFALGGDYGYEIHARYMERALGRALGAEESEAARQITLRGAALHAFQQARRYDPAASNLDDLIVSISDLSYVFPGGRDIPFGERRRAPFEEPGPIDAIGILDDLYTDLNADWTPSRWKLDDNELLQNVDRAPHPLDLMMQSNQRYREHLARN